MQRFAHGLFETPYSFFSLHLHTLLAELDTTRSQYTRQHTPSIPTFYIHLNNPQHTLNTGAQQLERALAELAQDNQKHEERMSRETKRNQKSEERKEKTLLKSLGKLSRLHV